MRAIGFFYLGARNGDSLPVLRQQFADFCDLNFHKPVNTFAADGEMVPRETPEYRRMIEYMRDSGSEFLVAVPDATHLGSDLESVARAFVELEQTGAGVRCFDEEFPDPLQNAFQTLGVKGVSRTRSRRIKESMRERALQGQALGRPPYGYRIGAEGKLEVVPDEARVVELIFRLYTRDLMGFRLIVQHLNERGILTRRGSNWNVIGIRDILRNPVYTGTYTRLGMRRPRTHEAIIPHDMFREARGVTESRRPLGRVSKSEPFLLSGLIECGYCGNKMMGVTRRQSWRRQDGRRQRGVYRYYQCQSKNNQSVCGYHTWRAPLLEGTVIGQLGPALRARAAGASDGEAERAQALRDERVKHAERRLLDAMRRTARGERKTYLLADYLAALDTARKAASGETSQVDVDQTLSRWEDLEMETQRDFLASHVARIVVKDETIQVLV